MADQAKLSRYAMFQQIGQGPHTKILHAVESQTGKNVAIKVIDTGMYQANGRAKLLKEIEYHMRMRPHPNIIQIYDHFMVGLTIYIVMELASGGDLFHKLKAGTDSLSDLQKRKLMYQVCTAIEVMHTASLIHRDIKPENILLDEYMNAKLCDFGWTCHFDDYKSRFDKAGTYEYMSPECLRGELQHSPVDIWSLGILIYELYHGVEPFPGKNPQEILYAIYNSSAMFGQDVPDDALDIFGLCVRYDPQTRVTIHDLLAHRYFDTIRNEVNSANHASAISVVPAPSYSENISPSISRIESPLRSRNLPQEQRQQPKIVTDKNLDLTRLVTNAGPTASGQIFHHQLAFSTHDLSRIEFSKRGSLRKPSSGQILASNTNIRSQSSEISQATEFHYRGASPLGKYLTNRTASNVYLSGGHHLPSGQTGSVQPHVSITQTYSHLPIFHQLRTQFQSSILEHSSSAVDILKPFSNNKTVENKPERKVNLDRSWISSQNLNLAQANSNHQQNNFMSSFTPTAAASTSNSLAQHFIFGPQTREPQLPMTAISPTKPMSHKTATGLIPEVISRKEEQLPQKPPSPMPVHFVKPDYIQTSSTNITAPIIFNNNNIKNIQRHSSNFKLQLRDTVNSFREEAKPRHNALNMLEKPRGLRSTLAENLVRFREAPPIISKMRTIQNVPTNFQSGEVSFREPIRPMKTFDMRILDDTISTNDRNDPHVEGRRSGDLSTPTVELEGEQDEKTKNHTNNSNTFPLENEVVNLTSSHRSPVLARQLNIAYGGGLCSSSRLSLSVLNNRDAAFTLTSASAVRSQSQVRKLFLRSRQNAFDNHSDT